MTIEELPPPDGMGPVIGLLASLGSAALPALSSLSESPNEERRFWATMLIAKTGDHAAVPVLARRLLDPSPDVALAARRGLWRLRRAPEFAEVLKHAMSELGSGDHERSIPLIRALGQFHHVPAIPLLIGMLGSRDAQVLQAANEALREVARQDFGTNEKRWSAWWEQAKSMPRLNWVIAALEDRDRDLRLAAISELTEMTGFDFGYQSDLEPGRQAAALQRWREWLERDGRSRTPLPFPASGA
jgi:HEAT repeat protein